MLLDTAHCCPSAHSLSSDVLSHKPNSLVWTTHTIPVPNISNHIACPYSFGSTCCSLNKARTSFPWLSTCYSLALKITFLVIHMALSFTFIHVSASSERPSLTYQLKYRNHPICGTQAPPLNRHMTLISGSEMFCLLFKVALIRIPTFQWQSEHWMS